MFTVKLLGPYQLGLGLAFMERALVNHALRTTHLNLNSILYFTTANLFRPQNTYSTVQFPPHARLANPTLSLESVMVGTAILGGSKDAPPL